MKRIGKRGLLGIAAAVGILAMSAGSAYAGGGYGRGYYGPGPGVYAPQGLSFGLSLSRGFGSGAYFGYNAPAICPPPPRPCGPVYRPVRPIVPYHHHHRHGRPGYWW